MDLLTAYGLFAVMAMLVCYALEKAAAAGSFSASQERACWVPLTVSCKALGHSAWSN